MSKPPVFTTPSGHTATSRTVRRYVLIRDTEQGATILNRSDSAEALATIRRRKGAHAGIAYFIGDTHTARLRHVHPSGRIESPLEEATANLAATYGGVPAGERRPWTDAEIPDGALDRALAGLPGPTPQEREALDRAAGVDLTTPRAGRVRALLAEKYGRAVPVTDAQVAVVLAELDGDQAGRWWPCGCLTNQAGAHRVGCPIYPEGRR